MASPPDGSSSTSPPLPSVADNQAATANSIISTNNEVIDDPSIRALQVAMTAADAIRKSLQQMHDPEEELLWVPPGTLPGIVAFVVAGLVLSPLRSAVLSRAAAATDAASTSATIKGAVGRRQHASATAVAKYSDSTTNSTKTAVNNNGVGSFANLLDLIVTPAMAMIAAQVGLVVGTLYGSTYYLQRVIKEDRAADTNKGVNGFRTEHEKWDYDESSSSSSSLGKTDQEEPNNTNAILCKSLLNVAIPSKTTGDNQSSSTTKSDDLVGLDARRDELIFDTGRSSSGVPPPQLYPAWDPRQTTIWSLYKAIQHCQQQQQQQNSSK